MWYREWEMNGKYVGVTGVVYIMGDVWKICGSYRCSIQKSAYILLFSSPHATSKALGKVP